MKFTGDRITFTGFPPADDTELLRVFTQLSERMNEHAKARNHIIANRSNETNERYFFRPWLISIGMRGPEFKAARKVLLSPLSGHSAFRDDSMERRWKEKQAARKAHNP